MSRSDLRALSDEDLMQRLSESHATLKELGGRWRMDEHPDLDAAEAAVLEAEIALEKLRREADQLPEARARALATGSAADIRKISDRITDVRLDLRVAEAMVYDRQARLLEVRGRVDGEIGGPGRAASLEARDCLVELGRRVDLASGPINAAGNSAVASITAAAELRRKREALLQELAPVPAGTR